jgi:hypothetical protein
VHDRLDLGVVVEERRFSTSNAPGRQNRCTDLGREIVKESIGRRLLVVRKEVSEKFLRRAHAPVGRAAMDFETKTELRDGRFDVVSSLGLAQESLLRKRPDIPWGSKAG